MSARNPIKCPICAKSSSRSSPNRVICFAPGSLAPKDLSDDRRPPSAEREAEYAACEGMDASHPPWEGHGSPDDEEHTFVGSCEEVRYGEDGQWSPGNLS